MNEKWEEHWERQINRMIKRLTETITEKKDRDLIQLTVQFSYLVYCGIVPLITDFNGKYEDIDEEKLKNKLKKFKSNEVEEAVRFMLMDYFIRVEEVADEMEEEQRVALLSLKEKVMFELLKLNAEELGQLSDLREEKETVLHTMTVLKGIGLRRDANNQAIVDGVEVIKEQLFQQIDKVWSNY